MVKVALLAGGRGTRLSEETEIRPKPLVEIGGQPILQHIINLFHAQGFDDFKVAIGYKADCFKKWFDNTRQSPEQDHPDWSLELIDTGLNTNTGGRIKRLKPHFSNAPFFLAWGDGLWNADLRAMLQFHQSHERHATVMVVHPPARFGHVTLDGDQITAFEEKPPAREGWINGGVFVLNPAVFDYIEGDDTAFEKSPMETLAKDGQLMAFRHDGFWQCMDNISEKRLLEELWQTDQAPWRIGRN